MEREFLKHVILVQTEKAMAPHSSTLAWKIPWTEEPGRLQSMGLLRVGQNWATSLSLFTFMHWRRKWQPTPVFLPGESQGQGAWWAAVYGVAQSQTLLKRLNSSSSILVQVFVNCGNLGKYLTSLTETVASPNQVMRECKWKNFERNIQIFYLYLVTNL